MRVYPPTMVSTWDPIRRVAVQVKGVDPEAPELLMVEVELSAAPPGEWPHRFENPPDVDLPPSMVPPKVDRAVVRFRVVDDQLEQYISKIDERIASANEYYSGQVLPARLAVEQSKQAESDSRAARVADAQRRADAV